MKKFEILLLKCKTMNVLKTSVVIAKDVDEARQKGIDMFDPKVNEFVGAQAFSNEN